MRGALAGTALAAAVAFALAAAPAHADSVADAARLTASDGSAYGYLGRSIAMSRDGSVVVVGDPNKGAVYVFARPGDTWLSTTQVAKLTVSGGSTANDLGESVAVTADGSTIVAGDPVATVGGHSSQGAAYVFMRPQSGWEDETQSATLENSSGAALDNLGLSVSASADGSVVAISAPGSAAAGYVFARPTSGGWTGQLGPTAALDSPGGRGYAVAVSEDGVDVIVGDPLANNHQGAAYVFSEDRLAGQPPDWTQAPHEATLTASDGPVYLGESVAISGTSTAVLGSNKAAYVFEPGGPLGWSNSHQSAKLTAADGQTFGGVGISSDGTTIVAGAPDASVGGESSQGAVYGFRKASSGWADGTETVRMAASNGGQGDGLGVSVAISADASTVAGGAMYATVDGNPDQGAAYVLRSPTTTATSCDPSRATVGQQTTCSFTVSNTLAGVTPTGTVGLSTDSAGSFSRTACSLASTADPRASSCSAVYTTAGVGSRTHTITATYGGDLGHATSSGTDALGVSPASSSASFTCDPGQVMVGTLSGCTVIVTVPAGTATPTGSVSLTTDSAGSFAHGGSCSLAPTATATTASCELNYTPLETGSGSHLLTAGWSGDPDHTGSSGRALLAVTAAPTATALRCAPESLAVGSADECTAIVAETALGNQVPGGTVAFAADGPGAFDRSSCSLSPGPTAGAGSCQVRYTPSTAGARAITALYLGDQSHSGSHESALIAVTPSPVPKLQIASVRLIRHRRLIVARLACPQGETFCDGSEWVYTTRTFAAARRKPRRRRVLLGKARFHIPGGAVQTVTVRLGKRSARALVRERPIRLTLSAVAHDAARRYASVRLSTVVR